MAASIPPIPPLRIAHPVYQAIRAHAEQSYPLESCGALLGLRSPTGWDVSAIHPLATHPATASRTSYQIPPAELVRMHRAAHHLGLTIVGFYHSHPDQSAIWSPTDLDQAYWLGCSCLITAVLRGQATATTAFALLGDSLSSRHFAPQTLEITHPAPDESPANLA